MISEQTANTKVDTLEELFLNRPLNDGDAGAVSGRTQLLLQALKSNPINVALNQRVDDIIANAQGTDRQRLRDQFNHWLSLVP